MQDPKKELQRLGIRIIDILSTEYKNSADIELSLAAQETILTRGDVDTIVIFAGDRDYMPIANRARESGKNLHFVGFEKSLSGDLKRLVGKETIPMQGRKICHHIQELENLFPVAAMLLIAHQLKNLIRTRHGRQLQLLIPLTSTGKNMAASRSAFF